MFASESEIFVYDYEFLKDVLKNPTKMGLIDASKPLRRQLLDQHIHKIIRRSGQKLFFRVSPEVKPSPIGGAGLFTIWSSISPVEGGTVEMITVQKFLARTAVRLPNTTMTVRNTIDYFANRAGGVHYGPVKQNNEMEFVRLGETLEIAGMPSLAFIFIDIIKTFVSSTTDLYNFAITDTAPG